MPPRQASRCVGDRRLRHRVARHAPIRIAGSCRAAGRVVVLVYLGVFQIGLAYLWVDRRSPPPAGVRNVAAASPRTGAEPDLDMADLEGVSRYTSTNHAAGGTAGTGNANGSVTSDAMTQPAITDATATPGAAASRSTRRRASSVTAHANPHRRPRMLPVAGSGAVTVAAG